MHHRLSLWMALLVFATVGVLRAQTAATPAAAATTMQPGQIVAKQVTGKVSVRLNGDTTDLHNNDSVSQASTVTTAKDSSVVLVFSNGATTQLGADSTLVIEEYLQDPFQQTVAVASLTSEPTISRTRLHLTKGELVGKVAKLKHDQGSSFTVQTPVGAAGIRGTTFRIVFRPTGLGQAFAVFSLSTVEGNVNFRQGGPAAGQGQGMVQDQSQSSPQGGGAGAGEGAVVGAARATPGLPGGTEPGAGGAGTSGGMGAGGLGGGAGIGGVSVGGGQEVVVTVSVNVNPQTGQLTIAAPTITSTRPISIETQALIVQQAQTIVTAVATTSFAPSAPVTSNSTTPTPDSSSTESQPAENSSPQPQQQQPQTDTPANSNNSGSGNGAAVSGNPNAASGNSSSNSGSSNNGSNPASAGNTGSGGANAGGTNSNTPPRPTSPMVPPVTTPTQPLTPGAGRSPG